MIIDDKLHPKRVQGKNASDESTITPDFTNTKVKYSNITYKTYRHSFSFSATSAKSITFQRPDAAMLRGAIHKQRLVARQKAIGGHSSYSSL